MSNEKIYQKLLPDGVRLQSSVDKEYMPTEEKANINGIHVGVVIDVIYPDEENSVSKKWIEISGMIMDKNISFNNAPLLSGMYNVNDLEIYIPRATTGIVNNGAVNTSSLNSSSPFDSSDFDGDRVLVAFVGGYSQNPMIIGVLPNPHYFGNSSLPTRSDGRIYRQRFGLIDLTRTEKGNIIYECKSADSTEAEGDITVDVSKTKSGNIIIKTSGAKSGNVTIDASNATTGDLTFKSKQFTMSMTSSGISIDTTGGSGTISIKSNSSVTIDGSSEVTLNCAAGINLNTTGVVTSSLVKIDGKPFGLHQHPTAVGPTGPVIL